MMKKSNDVIMKYLIWGSGTVSGQSHIRSTGVKPTSFMPLFSTSLAVS